MLNTPLSLRWRRAKLIAKNGAIRVARQKGETWTAQVHGTADEPYSTQVRLDKWGGFKTGSCTCPDYVGMFAYIIHNHPFCSYAGMPLYRGKLVCKHMLGLSLKAYLELEAEFLQ